jgi:hypothetical protein
MRTAILANLVHVVVAAQLDVVAVVRNADRNSSLSSRLYGFLGGKKMGTPHARNPLAASPSLPVAPMSSAVGQRAEYARMLTARPSGRVACVCQAGGWRSERHSTSLLAALALGIAG